MTKDSSTDYQAAREREEAQISRVLSWLSIAALLCLFSLGSKAWFAEHHNHALILWGFSIPVLANMIWFASTGNRAVQKAGFLVFVGILFTYLLTSGGENDTGPLWFYVLPPLLFFLINLKTGILILLLVYLMITIVFLFPGLPFVLAEYESDFKIRFLTTLTFASFFCLILEASRLKARNQLMDLALTHELAAKTDELTGLSNRRDILNRLAEEFSRYQRTGRHFSIALIDLDLFKKINDQYGHHAGDAALKQFASLVQSIVRQTDIAARWGGEEFLVLLPDTSLIPALTLAERLRAEVAKTDFNFQGQSLSVTMSAGVCSISQTDSVDNMLKQADLQLYSAKDTGRNQIAPRVRSQESNSKAAAGI